MLSYCLKYRKNAESRNLKVVKAKNRKVMVTLNCAVCGSKKLRLIKKQEANSFRIRTSLSLL